MEFQSQRVAAAGCFPAWSALCLDADRNRAHLLPAAVALFAEQGYERTTAAQIGERP
jgi:AcrR family transcriptional regulator